MSTDWVARGIAAVSVFLAVVSLVWSVLSWRLSGPSLRVHCLAYREVLLVRIFNAGRTAESIEHIVLGGRKGGMGGLDLTDELGLPLRLEPGETTRWRLNPAVSPLVERWSVVSGGWESLWVLSGSMRQRRVEVMPLNQSLPPAVGWHLVPRRTNVARYAPLAMVAPLVVFGSGGASSDFHWLVALGGLLVGVRALSLIGAPRTFRRKRVERWCLALGWVLCVVELSRASTRPASAEVPAIDIAVLSVYVWVSLVLAVPGAVPQTADAIAEARRRASLLFTRLRRKRGSRKQ